VSLPVSNYPIFPGVGVPTFLRSPLVQELTDLDADVVVLGVPTDEGSPYRPGSRFGPRAIREHSLRFGNSEGFHDPQTRQTYLAHEMSTGRIVDAGDVPILPTNVKDTFAAITSAVQNIVSQGALLVCLGGDHAIPFPIVRGFEQPLHVVQFDAHLDYEPFSHGLEMTNGHAFRHIVRMPHVQSLTAVGIRSIRNPQGTFYESLADGNHVVTMDEYESQGPECIIRAIPAGANVYVTIDIDVLDMSLIPGCVSAEPDGMSYRQLRDGLSLLAERMRIVGFDLCEVNPLLDVGTGITSYLATYTILEFLGRICQSEGFAERSNGAASMSNTSARNEPTGGGESGNAAA
jgi:agmatinase